MRGGFAEDEAHPLPVAWVQLQDSVSGRRPPDARHPAADGDDPSDGFDDFAARDDSSHAIDDAVDLPSVGVRYFARAAPRHDLSFSGGVRASDPDVYLGARLLEGRADR